MKKIVLIPDSFKGTMSSKKICDIMQTVIKKHQPDTNVVSIPVADGGEGSVDSFIEARGGMKVSCIVKDPYFEDMEAFYGWIDGNTAVIEMAACAGLPLVEGRENPMLTTTFGVGQMIAHAIDHGAKKIIMGLGGSATNDGGTGAASALGTLFYNQEGDSFIPTGGTLNKIDRIDGSFCKARLKEIEIITMCDIDNPLYGECGAAYIFSPQKGANHNMVIALDKGLRHLAEIIKASGMGNVDTIKGAGAAGGMGAGMVAFFGSRLEMGIETILDLVHFDALIQDADLVLTGEGRIDSQSLNGKVVMGVARRTYQVGVPLIAVVGSIEEGIEPLYDAGVSAIISINKSPLPIEIAKLKSCENMRFTMDNLMRILKI
ncbi:MAG: glycerate kinase [Cellulosilyticaceae bacterium]